MAVNYDDLREGDNFSLKMGGVDRDFTISTEDTLSHGHGMPGEYCFELSYEEKDVIKWLVEDFDIMDYSTEIAKFITRTGLECTMSDFFHSLRFLKLMTKAAKKQDDQPDLLLYGQQSKYFYMEFRHHQLLGIRLQGVADYVVKNRLVEADGNNEGGAPAFSDVYKYNSRGNKLECCTYRANGDIDTLKKYDDEGRVVMSSRFNADGSLEKKGVKKFNDSGMLVEYCTWSGKGILQSMIFYNYNKENALVEISTYSGKGNLELMEKYNGSKSFPRKTEAFLFYENGSLKSVQKYDSYGCLVESRNFQTDGTVSLWKKKD